MKQLTGAALVHPAITLAAPGPTDLGIDLTQSLTDEQMRVEKWILSVTITVAPATLTLWGCLALGVPDTESDDLWGLHNDRWGIYKSGILGTALPIGVYHFQLTDLGTYARIWLQKSAGTVAAILSPIYETDRGS